MFFEKKQRFIALECYSWEKQDLHRTKEKYHCDILSQEFREADKQGTIIISVLTEVEIDIISHFMVAQDLGDKSSVGIAQKYCIYLLKSNQFIEFVTPCEVVVASLC